MKKLKNPTIVSIDYSDFVFESENSALAFFKAAKSALRCLELYEQNKCIASPICLELKTTDKDVELLNSKEVREAIEREQAIRVKDISK